MMPGSRVEIISGSHTGRMGTIAPADFTQKLAAVLRMAGLGPLDGELHVMVDATNGQTFAEGGRGGLGGFNGWFTEDQLRVVP